MVEKHPTLPRLPQNGRGDRSLQVVGVVALALGVTFMAAMAIILVAYVDTLSAVALPSPAVALLLLGGFTLFAAASRRR